MEEAQERMLEAALARGAVALKTSMAYERPLRYGRWTRAEAEAEFNRIFEADRSLERTGRTYVKGPKYQDYMMHRLFRLANRKGLAVQVHTGLQEGSGNEISFADPSLLANVFMDYPDARFDIFHMGYPYEHVLSALAKNFPNVYIDLCWANIISPRAVVDALVEWLDAMPYTKILGFGGDYGFVDGVYGHLWLARRNVARALSVKVDEDGWSLSTALAAAEAIFAGNPRRVFGLGGGTA
jgi:predicted TIM-barrel fold metal-dependent hydrolase